MERFKLVVAVHLMLIENGKILLLRRYNTGYEDGNYSVVAGHIDGNESVVRAMRREALEEAGIKIKEEDLEIVHVMHRKSEDRESIDYFLTCKSYTGKISIMEKDKCDELKFYDLDKLPINVIPYVRKGIEYYQNDVPFSIYGW
ncbi:MAG: NUDIX domain-containing protein [Clostridia bacterium]|nr:NUDIX domain-containing protein [Clostridia bacterium]